MFSIPKEGPLSDADVSIPDFIKRMAESIQKSSRVLITSVREPAASVGGAFAGLLLPETRAGHLALAGAGASSVNNSRTVNINGLYVNGCNAKNGIDPADTVVQRGNEMLNEDSKVWGRYIPAPSSVHRTGNSETWLDIEMEIG